MVNFSLRRRSGRTSAWLFFLSVSLYSNAPAGVLSDFERDATHSADNATPAPPQPAKTARAATSSSASSSSSANNGASDNEADGSPVLWLVAKIFVGLMGAGGVNSFEYALGGSQSSSLPLRDRGDALLPFLRMEAGKHFVSTSIDGGEWRAQAGAGPFAINYRHYTYTENGVPQGLTLQQWQLAYRMLATQDLGIGVWMGSSQLRGTESHKGFALHLPVDWRVTNSLLLTLDMGAHLFHRGAISDHSIELRYGTRFSSLYGGYRWMASENKRLNGPIVGMSFFY